VSLGVALEQGCLPYLTDLSIIDIHVRALEHLKPSPSAKWCGRIESLDLKLYEGSLTKDQSQSDQLQIIHRYVQCFDSLRRLRFGWVDRRGPLPTSTPYQHELSNASLTTTKDHPNLRSTTTKVGTSIVTSRRLSHLTLVNMQTSADAVSSWLMSHASTLRDVHLDGVKLSSGTWDQALLPLTDLAQTHHWEKQTRKIWDVPIMLGSDIAGYLPEPIVPDLYRQDSGIQMGQASLAKSQALKLKSARHAHVSHPYFDNRLPSSTKQRATGRQSQNAVKQCRFVLPPDKPPTLPPSDKKRSLWDCLEVRKIFRGGILRWP